MIRMETEMNKLKLSTALVLAALSFGAALPAMAATSATVVTATKSDAVPIVSLVPMVGAWKSGDLALLDKATSVKVFDTKTLYQGADLSKIASAETAKNAELMKFRDAIRADAALDAWFGAHKIDVNRVIAVSDPSGSPEIFLY
jgi:hypothetical protein